MPLYRIQKFYLIIFSVDRRRTREINKDDNLAWKTYKLVKKSRVNQLAACIDDVYYAEIGDPDERLNGFTIRELLDHIHTR